jgi:hypothetical protein
MPKRNLGRIGACIPNRVTFAFGKLAQPLANQETGMVVADQERHPLGFQGIGQLSDQVPLAGTSRKNLADDGMGCGQQRSPVVEIGIHPLHAERRWK